MFSENSCFGPLIYKKRPIKILFNACLESSTDKTVDVSCSTYTRPLMALALCSSSGFRGWTGVDGSGGESDGKLGYVPGSRV